MHRFEPADLYVFIKYTLFMKFLVTQKILELSIFMS